MSTQITQMPVNPGDIVGEEHWAKRGDIDLFLFRRYSPKARAASPDKPVGLRQKRIPTDWPEAKGRVGRGPGDQPLPVGCPLPTQCGPLAAIQQGQPFALLVDDVHGGIPNSRQKFSMSGPPAYGVHLPASASVRTQEGPILVIDTGNIVTRPHRETGPVHRPVAVEERFLRRFVGG